MTSINIRFLKIVILFTIFPFLVNGQNNTDTISADTTGNANYSFLMLNASFTNNNLEYITGATEKIPVLFTNILFAHKSGIYIGGAYTNYFNTSINSYDYNIQAGYQKYFDNGFDFDLSYSYHSYEGDTLLEGLSYNNSVNLSGGVDIGKMYLSGDFSYMQSQSGNYFLDINLSRSFQVNKLLFKNDVLLINPAFSISFGTDYWIYEDMTKLEKNQTFANLRANGYSYNAMSYEGIDFFIPVSYGINNVYFSISWLYRIPGNKLKYLGWENQSGFMFSLTYFLNFSGKQ